MKLLVTGASGWIGRAVVYEARRRGFDVVVTDRAGTSTSTEAVLTADVGGDGFFRIADDPRLSGVRAVIHCAGYAHRPNETGEERRFDEINRKGTLRVLALAERVGIRRVVYISSIAFYDWSRGGWRRETDPVVAHSAYAASKLEGERACLRSGLDCRVVRFATVFGDGDRANFAKLAVALGRRRFAVPGAGAARKSVVPIALAAALLVDLAARESVPYTVMNIALPEAPDLGRICDDFSDICGFRRAPRLPMFALWSAALVGDVVARAFGRFPVTTSNLGKLTTETTVDVSRMVETWCGRQWPTFRGALIDYSSYYKSLVT